MAQQPGCQIDQKLIDQARAHQRAVEFVAGFNMQLVDLARCQVAQHGRQIHLLPTRRRLGQGDHSGPEGLQSLGSAAIGLPAIN